MIKRDEIITEKNKFLVIILSLFIFYSITANSPAPINAGEVTAHYRNPYGLMPRKVGDPGSLACW